MRNRKGMSRDKIGLLVILVVLLGGVGYGVYMSLLGGSGACPGNPGLVTISGSLVAQPSGIGNLTLNVKNTAIAPLSRIIVINSSLPSSTSIEFYYNGAVVSNLNALPVGKIAMGSLQVGNVTGGSDYHMTISTTIASCGQLISTLELKVQT